MLRRKKFNKVMLVEDSASINRMNSYFFRKLNATNDIVVAKNGAVALEYLTKQNKVNDDFTYPELIVLDLNMPVMGGIEFLDHYEKLDAGIRNKITIVILATSILETRMKKLQNSSSVAACLSKPLTKKRIEEITETYAKLEYEDI